MRNINIFLISQNDQENLHTNFAKITKLLKNCAQQKYIYEILLPKNAKLNFLSNLTSNLVVQNYFYAYCIQCKVSTSSTRLKKDTSAL